MAYNFDPEFQPLLDMLPDNSLGISDPVKAREGFREIAAT